MKYTYKEFVLAEKFKHYFCLFGGVKIIPVCLLLFNILRFKIHVLYELCAFISG